ncbi:ATP-binding protein [Pseudomonas resinovorans]|uniref:ATP-binding protein n=1 Tax=Metapseudomonas resinovorans TaxID=53412 RepID=A0ABT4Y7X6_METRE|nr:ATP-binding protein [Pseudomonas resinovorans]MDA8484779.1 ATP-binding protein [Pseudomonas resinovorans]
MSAVVETEAVQQALALAQTLLSADSNRVGKIDGKPGTGKSTIAHYLVERLKAVRVCAYPGMSTKALMIELASALGLDVSAGTGASQLARLRPRVRNRLVIVDEANHLKWPQFEGLRFLADEAGMALLLVGTDLMNRQFRTPQTGVYLAQLASRIGAKTLHLTRMRRIAEGQAYVLQPMFGTVEHATAKRFLQVSQGYWRDSLELARACQRLMSQVGAPQLTLEVVEAAAQWMAEGRRETGAFVPL